MLRKIFSLAVALVIVLSLGASCKPNEPEGETADWDALYETVLDWGYEGNFDEFVAILTEDRGDIDNPWYAHKSAYEILGSFKTEEGFIEALLHDKWFATPVSHGFYSLTWAYNHDMLTHRELRSIAYYYHDGKNVTYNRFGKERWTKDFFFVPNPKKPKVLDEETQDKIRQAYLAYTVCGAPENEDYINKVADYIQIGGYYGTYNGYAAIMMTECYDAHAIVGHKIDDICFYYATTRTAIRLWKEKE